MGLGRADARNGAAHPIAPDEWIIMPVNGRRMTVGSVFSGIGGFDLGLQRAGHEIRWQIEIDKWCHRVLARHWPAVRRVRDVHTVASGRAQSRRRHGLVLEPVDLICAGFPCQDVSVAGRRAGLRGPQSGLFFVLMRLVRIVRPTWVLIENVPGLLNQNYGADFATVLDTLEDAGYVGAWRTLDSQWFGVPQRRRRIFLVGHRGDGAAARSVLFEPPSRSRHPQAGQEARPDLAYCLAASVRGTGDQHGQGWNTTYVAGALRSSVGGPDDNRAQAGHALSAAKSGQRFDPNREDYIVTPTLQGGHSGEPEPGSGLLLWQCHGGNVGPMGTLRTGEGTLTSGVPSIAATLNSGGNAGGFRTEPGEHLIASHTTQITSRHNRSAPQPGDPCHPLAAAAHPPALAYGCWNKSASQTMRADEHTTDALQGSSSSNPAIGVRRLTPLECERLQGCQDGWTCLCGCTPYRTADCRCPDSPRYRALGNAVTVSVAEWIGRRLVEVIRDYNQ